jgi:hypothetical protein
MKSCITGHIDSKKNYNIFLLNTLKTASKNAGVKMPEYPIFYFLFRIYFNSACNARV